MCAGAPSGWDSAMVKLGFKKEAGEGTRSMKEQLKSGTCPCVVPHTTDLIRPHLASLHPLFCVCSAGLAGVLSYVSSEVLFWAISLPLGVLAWHAQTGEWLDLSTGEGQAKVISALQSLLPACILAFPDTYLPMNAGVDNRTPEDLLPFFACRWQGSVRPSWPSRVWHCPCVPQ